METFLGPSSRPQNREGRVPPHRTRDTERARRVSLQRTSYTHKNTQKTRHARPGESCSWWLVRHGGQRSAERTRNSPPPPSSAPATALGSKAPHPPVHAPTSARSSLNLCHPMLIASLRLALDHCRGVPCGVAASGASTGGATYGVEITSTLAGNALKSASVRPWQQCT